MKYKVTRQELNECIAEAVAKVLKEETSWDDIDAILANAEKDTKAKRAAEKDSNKEAAAAAADDAKVESGENAEMNTDDEDNAVDSNNSFNDYYRMDYDTLVSTIKELGGIKTRQGRIANKELIKRKNAYEDLKEGLPCYGYKLDAQGKVQPTHVTVGEKNDDAWEGRGADFSGLNHNVGAFSREY